MASERLLFLTGHCFPRANPKHRHASLLSLRAAKWTSFRRMKRLSFILTLVSVVSTLSFVAGSALAVPANPTVAIGSTTGTGPGGCVKYSKLVGFSMSSSGYSYFTGSRVYLDGKLVNVRNGYLPRLLRKGRSAQWLQEIGFSSLIKLTGLASGKHTIKLVGLTVAAPVRRPSGSLQSVSLVAGNVTATKTIRKCAAFTG